MKTIFSWIEEYLTHRPVHLAFIRPVELSFYRDLAFDPPVLDLGCGDGFFFGSLSRTLPSSFGLDYHFPSLAAARKSGAYRGLVRAKGEILPFRSARFGTVMSNSSLEHMVGLEPILDELHRILIPGGRLYFTVPGKRFGELLLGSEVLKKLGLPSLSRGYGDFFNWHSRHRHVYNKETWNRILGEHGFAVQKSWDYLHAPAMHGFDLSHYYGIVSLLVKLTLGRWRLFPQKWKWIPMARYIHDRVTAEMPEEGACYFFSCTRC